MESVSIITTCKGRLAYLKDSISSWLSQELEPEASLEIVVVDFGCPDGAAEWCVELGDARVRPVRAVNNVQTFNLARARNIGGRLSASDLLAFVDADIALHPHFVRRYSQLLRGNGADYCVAGSQNVHGTWFTSSLCVVKRELFERVRGYDEAISDYGEDDTDFYRRCKFHGAVEQWAHWDAEHRQCSDEERVRFYENKSIRETIERNVAQTADPSRQVNCGAWGAP